MMSLPSLPCMASLPLLPQMISSPPTCVPARSIMSFPLTATMFSILLSVRFEPVRAKRASLVFHNQCIRAAQTVIGGGVEIIYIIDEDGFAGIVIGESRGELLLHPLKE